MRLHACGQGPINTINGVINERKARGLATTKGSPEAEAEDVLVLGLVQLGNQRGELGLRDVGAAGVDDVNDHLLALQQAVGEELARAERHGF